MATQSFTKATEPSLILLLWNYSAPWWSFLFPAVVQWGMGIKGTNQQPRIHSACLQAHPSHMGF